MAIEINIESSDIAENSKIQIKKKYNYTSTIKLRCYTIKRKDCYRSGCVEFIYEFSDKTPFMSQIRLTENIKYVIKERYSWRVSTSKSLRRYFNYYIRPLFDINCEKNEVWITDKNIYY